MASSPQPSSLYSGPRPHQPQVTWRLDHQTGPPSAKHDYVAILGDLNDTPDSAALSPLVQDTDLVDVSAHPNFDWQGRHGTYGSSKTDKIDYILLSPKLFSRVTHGGVFRKGVYRGPRTQDPWPVYPLLTAKVHEGSDHAAVWAALDL